MFSKKESFVKSSKEDIKSFYDLNKSKVLGSGSFGQVFMATDKKNFGKFWVILLLMKRAIKSINKRLIKNAIQFETEVKIL